MREITGTIIDKNTGQPLPGQVHVWPSDEEGNMITGQAVATDANGNFALEVADDIEHITFSHMGYGQSTYLIDDLAQEILLSEQSEDLPEVEVKPEDGDGTTKAKKKSSLATFIDDNGRGIAVFSGTLLLMGTIAHFAKGSKL